MAETRSAEQTARLRKVRTCLWFDDQGEEAATFYTTLFAHLPGTGISAVSPIVPRALGEMMTNPDPAHVQRVVAAYMPMKKLELDVLEAAYRGN